MQALMAMMMILTRQMTEIENSGNYTITTLILHFDIITFKHKDARYHVCKD